MCFYLCYSSLVIITINILIKVRGADNFLHHNNHPIEEALCAMVELLLPFSWWATPLFLRGSVSDLILWPRDIRNTLTVCPTEKNAALVLLCMPPHARLCLLPLGSHQMEISHSYSHMRYPGGFGALFYMDFSLFTFLVVWGLLYVAPDLWVNTQSPSLEDLGDLSALKPTPMPPGCPKEASLSSVFALLSISDGFGLCLNTRLFHDGRDQIFGPHFVIPPTKFISGSDVIIFERCSVWLSEQCLDFARGKGKETL